MTNYAKIKLYDVENGSGLGVSLFLSGCSLHCKNCFNKDIWDYNYGKPITDDVLDFIILHLQDKGVTRFSILGGEPLDEKNLTTTSAIVQSIKKKLPHIKIWLWTGYNPKEVLYDEKLNECLWKYIDYVTLGRYVDEQKDLNRLYSGSTNQITLELPSTKIVE